MKWKRGKWNKIQKMNGKRFNWDTVLRLQTAGSFREDCGKVWPKKSEKYLRYLIFIMHHKLEDVQLRFLTSAGKKIRSVDYCKLNLILHSRDNNVLQ